MSLKTEFAAEAFKQSPPVVVTGLTLYGVSLQDWVLIATLIYTTVSLFFLLKDKVYKPWKERHGSK